MFVPVEVVPWWCGLAILPAWAGWRRWRSALPLAGAALAAAGVAYYRLVMAHRPPGYYALFEAGAALGLVLAGAAVASVGAVRWWTGAGAAAQPGSAPGRPEGVESAPPPSGPGR